jgi:hypothetical protein
LKIQINKYIILHEKLGYEPVRYQSGCPVKRWKGKRGIFRGGGGDLPVWDKGSKNDTIHRYNPKGFARKKHLPAHVV